MGSPAASQRRNQIFTLTTNSLLILFSGIALVAALLFQFPTGGQIHLTAGEVAQQDVIAPRRISYESEVRTRQARDRAALAVPDYYDPPQSRIRRVQVTQAREVLEFIATVRLDALAPHAAKLGYLQSINDLTLSQSMAETILALPADEWQNVVLETPLVLEQIMQEEIRETSLPAMRRKVPVLISPDLGDEPELVTTELVRALIRPNSFLNPERTADLREQAREAVPDQISVLEQGEILLRAGDIVSAEDVEALEQMGLTQTERSLWTLIQAVLVAGLILILVGGSLYRLRIHTLFSRQETALLVLLSFLGLVAAKVMIIPHDWMPYLFPLAALGMLTALLLDTQVAMIVVLSFTLLIAYLSQGDVFLIFYTCAGGLLGALVLGRAERLTAFLWAGSGVIGSNLLTVAGFWPHSLEATTTALVLQSITLALLNGALATSLGLIGYFTLGNLFGITTNLQLMELSRPTHPLLRQLLLKAPGTYHHTILVSNLAERAAEAIGADAFLTRVGAYYHDIGKTVRPYFFVENFADGDSTPHAGLDPRTSAQIIISHVKDGLDLARKYRLPNALQDFIREHHGAQMVTYFYRQAQAQEGPENVDPADFRYPGPDPRSKEATIMLLADICEAAVRAERPATRDDLQALVNRLITDRLLDGTLDSSPLSFSELQIVKRVFVQVLQGIHHPRIQYPEPVTAGREPVVKTPASPLPQPAPALPAGFETSDG
ncbi:MAG TPA: HDIG domain-containing protein [Caldilineaceae bacterium]|nr:HDIG domain-containing protein [Caldilineaceae bacterium]